MCITCAPSTSTGGTNTSNVSTANTTPTAPTAPSSSTKKTTPAPVPAAPNPNLPVIVSYFVDPAIIHEGDLTTLKWNIKNAASISISPTVGAIDPTGSKRISPETSTAYTLTASNSYGAVTAVATVMVSLPYSSLSPVVMSLTAKPRTVSENNSCELNWNVFGASVITLASATPDLTVSATTISSLPTLMSSSTPIGRKTVTPTYTLNSAQLTASATTTIAVANDIYYLTAQNWSGTTTAAIDIDVLKSAIIPKPGIPIAYDNMTVVAATVLPMIVWFAPDPYTIVKGNSATLTWEVNQATKVRLNGVEVSPVGSLIVSPAGTASYTLTASNQYYTETKAVTISVLGFKPEWFKPLTH